MYELVRAGAESWYIDCPAKIGIIELGGGRVCLIDSGSDKDAGRRARKVLDGQGWTLQCILNTHANADHIGGNQYLQSQTGCQVFSGGMEAAFTRHPLMEPSLLWGGYPMAALRHKFLMAQPSAVCEFDQPGFPRQIEIIPLPGHFLDMVGFRAPDGTVFLADCLTSEETLDKYHLTFVYDVAAYLNTLERVMQMQAPLFVPAHAPARKDIAPLARLNRQKVDEIAETILALCARPRTTETLLKAVFETYGLNMNWAQYALIGSTLRSYLSWLCDSGRVEGVFEDNLLLWHTRQATSCEI